MTTAEMYHIEDRAMARVQGLEIAQAQIKAKGAGSDPQETAGAYLQFLRQIAVADIPAEEYQARYPSCAPSPRMPA